MSEAPNRFEPLAAQHMLTVAKAEPRGPGARIAAAVTGTAAGIMASLMMVAFLVFAMAVLFGLSLKATFVLMVAGSVLVAVSALRAGAGED